MTTLHDDGVVEYPILGPGRGRVTVRLPSADLRIVPGAAGGVTVRSLDGRSVADLVVVESSDDDVTIRMKERFGLTFGRGSATLALEIVVPRDVEVVTDLASGDIESRGLRGVQRHRTASGDLHLLEAGGSLEITTVSGDTTIELHEPADLAFRSVSGDVDLKGASLTGLRASTTSGDVRLDSPLTGGTENAIETMSGDARIVAGAGIRVEARTVSGDLSTDLPHRTDGRMGRRTLVLGDGSIHLAFRSVSGDLRIVPAGSFGAPEPPPLPNFPPPPGAPAFDLPASHGESTPDAPGAAAPPPSREDGDERMAVLRALERGELDVPTAMNRLAKLDDEEGGPTAGPDRPTSQDLGDA